MDIVEKLTKKVEQLEEYKAFVTDICFDYHTNPGIGLMAIRVLSKGKQDEETFKGVWMKWRESMGVPVTSADKEEA